LPAFSPDGTRTFRPSSASATFSTELGGAPFVGVSLWGGEAVCYLSRYGTVRVSRLGVVSSVTPYLGRTEDNPEGVPEDVFAEMLEGIRKDQIAFLDE